MRTEVTFLNRDDERASLLAALPPHAVQPQLLIVRGPTGVGKSSLTDWVSERVANAAPTVIVDPYIRGKDRDPNRAYNGYFLQLCVAAMSEVLPAMTGTIDPFSVFVRSRGIKNLKDFDLKGTMREVASVSKLVGRAVDAAERVTGKGTFSPEALLKSDSSSAIEICAEYFSYVASEVGFVMVVREAQHCDTMSLRHILRSLSDDGKFYPLIEYTTENHSFQKRHDVQIKQLADPKIWDIDILDWPYVAELLERYGQHDQKIIGEFQARWDGNLRSIEELRYRVAYRSGHIATNLNTAIPHNAVAAISERMVELSRAVRLVLAILLEHNEPIFREAFNAIWESIDPNLGLPLRLSDVIVGMHDSFLSISTAQVGLNNDDVASAISGMPDAALYTTDARRLLLAFYDNVINNSQSGGAPRAVAMRHAIRLAALMQDPILLENTLKRLDTEIDAKGDPTIYVNQVIACLKDASDLGQGERTALASWAARHAYRSSNFDQTVQAIEIGELSSPKWRSVLAHALIEEHRESEAVEIATQLRTDLPFDNADLMADLILGNLDLVKGNLSTCVRRLERTVIEAKSRKSVLLGHAYRLLESAVETEKAIEYCQLSTDVFDRAGLCRSAGQSRLTMTRHLARTNCVQQARSEIESAEKSLSDVASSRQFLLNNKAAVELMSPTPDYITAAGDLRSALLLSKDRFSDLTILQNLAIAIWQERGAEDALETIHQAVRALRELDTTTALMADSVGCVAVAILNAAGKPNEANDVATFVIESVGVDIDADPYWSWRYGRSDKRPDTYADYVLDKPYHPNFLSQWQLDWEVLRALFQ